MRKKEIKESIRNRILFLMKMFSDHATIAWHIGEEFPNVRGEFFITEDGINIRLYK